MILSIASNMSDLSNVYEVTMHIDDPKVDVDMIIRTKKHTCAHISIDIDRSIYRILNFSLNQRMKNKFVNNIYKWRPSTTCCLNFYFSFIK